MLANVQKKELEDGMVIEVQQITHCLENKKLQKLYKTCFPIAKTYCSSLMPKILQCLSPLVLSNS